jgi:hypothetical protein
MPETTPYLMLGLGVIFAILLVYLGSLVVRFRNAAKDLQVLEDLK